MKLVFLCNEYPPYASPGGIGTFTHTIAHGLVGCGHEVTVLGFGKISGEWGDDGVRVVILPESTIRRVAWFLNRRRLYCWLRQQAQEGQIDIIEASEYQGMLPFRFPWCPVVVRLHTSFRPETRILRYLERRTLGIHKNWIAVSDWSGRDTQKKYRIAPLTMSVVYNPVNGCGQKAEARGDLLDNYVLYAGTVSDRKGAFVLAEAARSFLAPNPDLHLVYVGGLIVENGRRADETIRHILGDRYGKRVHFTGPVHHDSVLAYMKGARVFAFPSKLESFGLVPAEAMACGVPVVYSTLHAGPEVIDDGVTGLLADPYSSVDVAEKVMRLLNDKAFAAQLAGNAKQAVKERFSLQRCIDETVAFYTAILTKQ